MQIKNDKDILYLYNEFLFVLKQIKLCQQISKTMEQPKQKESCEDFAIKKPSIKAITKFIKITLNII